MLNTKLRQMLFHLAAAAVFLAVTLTYFSPLIEGKRLKQDDIARWKGMAKEIDDFRARKHEEPLWTNSMFEIGRAHV